MINELDIYLSVSAFPGLLSAELPAIIQELNQLCRHH